MSMTFYAWERIQPSYLGFKLQISKHISIMINIKISSFDQGMYINHHIPNKIMSVSLPGYIDNIFEKFHIGQISHKSQLKKYLLHQVILLMIILFHKRNTINLYIILLFVFIYEICISKSFEFGKDCPIIYR